MDGYKEVRGYIVPTARSGKWNPKIVGGEVGLEVFRVPLSWVKFSGVDGKEITRHLFKLEILGEDTGGVMKVEFPLLDAMGSLGSALVTIYRAKNS